MALQSSYQNHIVEVLLIILICILLLIIVLAIVRYSSFYSINQAILATINNDIFCPKLTTDSLCLLQANLNLVVPDNSSTFNSLIGQFSCNLIACVEEAFLQIKPGTINKQESNHQITPTIKTPKEVSIRHQIYYQGKLIGIICTSEEKKSIWIAFRGTNGKNEWQKDLMIQQVTSSIFVGKIHDGFLTIYQSIRNSLLHSLSQIVNIPFQPNENNNNNMATKYTSLYIGGHSLGGTCSQFLLSDPLLNKALINIKTGQNTITNKQVFLFGVPRIGNQVFCDSQKGYFIYRYQNQVDIACQLPPSISPNFIGNKYDVFLYNNYQTKLIEFYNQRSSYVENHSLKTYLFYFQSILS